MRTLLAIFALFLMPCVAFAQDDPGAQAAQAAQEAAQQSQQAAMQAMQDASAANAQAAAAAQQSMNDSQNSLNQACCISLTAAPKFSVKPGDFSAPITVKITDSTRGAVIYYTTDGWTPTALSPRYRGPVVVDSTATLQAVAISPYSMRSLVASAKYSISGTSAGPSGAAASAAMAPTPKGTPVHLIFAGDVSSKTASVGDKIPLTLAEDVQFGNGTIPKGAAADVIITAVDSTGAGGAPGSITFEADSLQTSAGPVPLIGTATKEGVAKPPNAAALIPVVGVFTLFKHGTDATIAKGTPFTAYLAAGN